MQPPIRKKRKYRSGRSIQAATIVPIAIGRVMSTVFCLFERRFIGYRPQVSPIGDTPVIAKKTPINQPVERSLLPMALSPAGLNPVKPKSCILGLVFLSQFGARPLLTP